MKKILYLGVKKKKLLIFFLKKKLILIILKQFMKMKLMIKNIN